MHRATRNGGDGVLTSRIVWMDAPPAPAEERCPEARGVLNGIVADALFFALLAVVIRVCR